MDTRSLDYSSHRHLRWALKFIEVGYVLCLGPMRFLNPIRGFRSLGAQALPIQGLASTS